MWRRLRIPWIVLALWCGACGVGRDTTSPTSVPAAPTTRLDASATPGHSAGEHRVEPGGDDTDVGTPERPWATIGHALRQLGPGDTLTIGVGDYHERVTGGPDGFVPLAPASAARPIVVVAEPGATLHGLLWIEGADHWTFDGLRVVWDADAATADEHMVRVRDGVGWTLTNSELSGARSHAALNIVGTGRGEPANWVVSHSCIHDTIGDRSHGVAEDQLIYVHTGVDAGRGLIERNLLFGSPRGKAVKLGGPRAGTGSTGVEVRYNTMADTRMPPVNIAWDSHHNEVHHNLLGAPNDVDKGTIRGFELRGVGNRAHDNLSWGVSRSVFVDGASATTVSDTDNVVGGDPGFDSRTCDGFHPSNPVAATYGRWAPSSAQMAG